MDRETYLSWKTGWKANYADLSQQIREARTAYHEAQRKFSLNYDGRPQASNGWKSTPEYRSTWLAEGDCISKLLKLRKEATSQLTKLHAEKFKAAEAMLAKLTL